MPELLSDDPRAAVAITGSAARGDASTGSDLDLWCVSPKHAKHHRVHGTFRGIDVTLLCDSARSARAERSLMRCEVADLIVLRDPRGEFRDIQKLGRARAKRTWAALCRTTSTALVEELGEASRGPPWNRLPPLREAALRFAATWVYRRRGWRTPRWRTLRQVLPAAQAQRLARILALPTNGAGEAMLTTLARLRRLPDDVTARRQAKEWGEAVLLARRAVEREWMPLKPSRWTHVPKKLERAVRALHGEPSEGDVTETLREVQALAASLDVLRYFSPRVRRALHSA